jgi:hypothetical protein
VTGLIGWWPLHENSGRAKDLSGKGNHGNLNGGVKQGVAGKGGLTAYSFDGENDYVDISGAYGAQSLGFTISAWAYRTDSLSNDRNVLSGEDSGQRVIGIGGDSSGEIQFSSYDGDGHKISTSMEKYRWYNLLGTVTANGTMEFFVNGQSVGTNSTSELANNTPEWYIGAADLADSPGYWPGRISDARIYDRVLSSQEIQTLYEWGNGDYTDEVYHDGTDPGALSRWRFNDGSDTENAQDYWNSLDGTINGANYNEDSIRGKAISLDGSSSVSIPDGSLVGGSNPRTVSAWVKPDTLTNDYTVLGWGEKSTSKSWYIRLNTTNDGELFVLCWDNNFKTGKKVIENKAWNHIAVTYNGTGEENSIKAYINGVRKDLIIHAGDWTVLDTSVKNGAIGYRSIDDKNYFEGGIDDVRVYDRALDSWEVQQLYQWGTRGRDMRKLTVNSRGDQ